jgi:antitoxin PrlF
MAFLSFLDESMRKHPELVRPLTAGDISGLDDLLDGVDADLDAPLGDDDYVLP